jgi:hypothetical protein
MLNGSGTGRKIKNIFKKVKNAPKPIDILFRLGYSMYINKTQEG